MFSGLRKLTKRAIPSTFGWSPEAVPRRTPQKRTVTVPSDSYEGYNKKSSTSTSSTAEINLTNPTSVKKNYCDEKPSQDEDIEGTDSTVVRSKYFKREGLRKLTKGAIPSTFGWSPEAVPRRTPQKRTVTVPSDSYEGNNKKSSTSTSSTAEINLTNPTSVKKKLL
ncbi:uncharacterized protein [Argopecten irradians]|uniref:uncharacterized protein n=1 Tax=Argopecten irradians TaxID=31199 RepID=UPI0037145C79